MVMSYSFLTVVIYFLLSCGFGALTEKLGLTQGNEGLILGLTFFLLWYVHGYYKLAINLTEYKKTIIDKIMKEFENGIKKAFDEKTNKEEDLK